MSDDVLTVQVAGGDDEPERLLVISRPVGGRVHVREWSSGNWNTEPVSQHVPVDEMMSVFERAHQARRRISQDMYYIRTWLSGSAP